MPAVIEAHNLSKRYYLGEINQDAFFEDINRRARQIYRRLRNRETAPLQNGREFWALKGVSLEINQGETLAIIGSNGAGKSTLLKILSRITKPTTGNLTVRGRMASLLEVGTGFHPEFTGRDNIYLNGAILGLKKAEIQTRFDQIVEFSELGEFIDVPVKRYSSGMYIRLAFSVAANLNPEIMILDEVLAVGDTAFQQKCINRVQEIIREGHAAIMVSHSMNAMRQMADKCLWLKNGEVRMFGNIDEVATEYENETMHVAKAPEKESIVHFIDWAITGEKSGENHTLSSQFNPVEFSIRCDLKIPLTEGSVMFALVDAQTLQILCHRTDIGNQPAGRLTLKIRLPQLPIRIGSYKLQCTFLEGGHALDVLWATPELVVASSDSTSKGGQRGILDVPAEVLISRNE